MLTTRLVPRMRGRTWEGLRLPPAVPAVCSWGLQPACETACLQGRSRAVEAHSTAVAHAVMEIIRRTDRQSQSTRRRKSLDEPIVRVRAHAVEDEDADDEELVDAALCV